MSPVHMCECNLCLSLCVSQMVCMADILNHMGLYCGCQWLGYKKKSYNLKASCTYSNILFDCFLLFLINMYLLIDILCV